MDKDEELFVSQTEKYKKKTVFKTKSFKILVLQKIRYFKLKCYKEKYNKTIMLIKKSPALLSNFIITIQCFRLNVKYVNHT